MIAGLKPYPEYKESGVPWLGRIPSHWAVVRIKSIMRELDRRSTNGDGILLSLTRLRGLNSAGGSVGSHAWRKDAHRI